MRNLPAPVYVNYVNSEINLRFAKSINFLITESEVVTGNYYMALSHKDWELPNLRIRLAKTDIDRGLDFPI